MLSILSAIEVDIIILLVVFGSIWLLVIHCVGNRLIPFRQLSFHGSSRAAGLPYNPITAAAGTSLNTSSATREKQHKSETTRYDRSPQQWDRVLNDEEKKKIGATWLKKNSLDYWRHERMRKCIIPFVRENPNASWLTVGDGRYGTDANYLESLGAKSVHASDISDTLLRLGGKGGFISEYSAQNAESLAFPDNHFDYVYCKEAFHHFPRPFIALHEMFRVARKAVIFTEPRDAVIHLSLLKFMARKILRRSFGTHSFETVGNYVYLISERECEKFLLGMHYTHIAFTGCNDAYVSGVEFVPLSGGNWKQKRLRLFIRSLIVVMDALESIGVRHSSILTSALFKQEPSKALVSRLESAGWKVKNLPVNPYLNSEK